MRRLLSGPLAVGPNRHPADQVTDAEAFCDHYLRRAFRGWTMFLEPAEYDDSLQLLLLELLGLEDRFDERRNDSFASYARSIIPKRAADVGPRRLLGRNGNRLEQRQTLSLDQLGEHARPLHPLTPQPGDQDPDRGTDDRRLPPERDRERTRSRTVLGLPAARRAA